VIYNLGPLATSVDLDVNAWFSEGFGNQGDRSLDFRPLDFPLFSDEKISSKIGLDKTTSKLYNQINYILKLI